MESKKSKYDLPLKPPEGLLEWMLGNGLLDKSLITYKMEYYQDDNLKRRRAVRCTCSSCETSFYAKHVLSLSDDEPYGWRHPVDGNTVYHDQLCFCPMCDEAMTSYYIGKHRGNVLKLNAVGAVTIERINGHIAVIWWWVELLLRSGNIAYDIYPWEAYVFDGKRCVKNVAYAVGFWGKQYYTGQWIERSKCVDMLGRINRDHIYPFSSFVFDGTELENAKYDIYLKDNSYVYPVSYLRLYQRHSAVENLVMNGSSQIVDELLDRANYYHLVAPLSKSDKMINWKLRKPSAMLGLTKTEYKELKSASLNDIKLYLRTKDFGVTTENIYGILERNYDWHIETLVTEFKENVQRADRYIVKQQKKYNNGTALSELMDYWRMVEPVDRLKDPKVRYPQNLRHAHDELIRLKEWEEDKELIEKFRRRYEKLSIYSYCNDRLLIRPCRTEAELIIEGKVLDHCVASYAKRHAYGDTSIFFIRHVDRPDEPFYTLEWTGRRINQDHGYKNRLQTDEIKKFEKEWLEYVKGVDKNGEYSRKAS